MEPLFKYVKVICHSCKNSLIGSKKECYACKNGLVGIKKNDYEEWFCECSTWECRCEEAEFFFCPLCASYHAEFKGLKENVKGKISTSAYWVANIVTHYRHNHIESWNKMWDKRTGGYYRDSFRYEDSEYERRKEEVNERAKRQIIRKSLSYLRFHKITSRAFLELKGFDEKTLVLAKKKLDNE